MGFIFFIVAVLALLVGIAVIVLNTIHIASLNNEMVDLPEDGWGRIKKDVKEEIFVHNRERMIGACICAVAIVLSFASCIYTQGVGETAVIKNLGGSVAGSSTSAGFHLKAPWQSVIKYDIRNNVLSFMGKEEDEQFDGGSANGSAVTVNDKGGASATIDIQVNYSLDANSAEELYSDYGTQENFVRSICAVDIRAIPREVSGRFDTITILTAREEFTNAVQDKLAKKWKEYGLNVEQVSIQNVVYDETIVKKYSESQAAEIARATAENNKKVAQVNAETKIVEANGEAKANKILSDSLTDKVIQQHYIDAINKSDTVYVVPSDSTPMIQTNSNSKSGK